MTKREFLDTVFGLAPNVANEIMDAFDKYVEDNEPHWIPVTERLPNKQTKVIVVDFGEVDTAYLNSEGRWMDFHGDKLKDVTACMPLPKWEGDAE